MMVARNAMTASWQWIKSWSTAWDQFWFAPRLPHSLGLLRIATGLMLLYSHLVLASDLTSFLGDHAWVNNETARHLHDGEFGFNDAARSYLWYISDVRLIWTHHIVTIVITACFALGLLTRFTAPAAWFLQLMYLHRLTGSLFGLDQIVTYCAMYLMLAPCGSCFSLDARIRRKLDDRRLEKPFYAWLFPAAVPSVMANVATRLLQIHLCVIYMFGGLSKARGQTWWDGTAMWGAVANYEYQSMDTTWIVRYPRLFTAMTHLTLFWEVFYCALVWPRLTRPIAVGLAVIVHAGIAVSLGMITFGTMMIAANMIFVEPTFILRLMGRSSPGSTSDRDVDRESGVDDLDLMERERRVAARERELDTREHRLSEKKQRVKGRETKYRDRVKRLKDREDKIKSLVDRNRGSQESSDDAID